MKAEPMTLALSNGSLHRSALLLWGLNCQHRNFSGAEHLTYLLRPVPLRIRFWYVSSGGSCQPEAVHKAQRGQGLPGTAQQSRQDQKRNWFPALPGTSQEFEHLLGTFCPSPSVWAAGKGTWACENIQGAQAWPLWLGTGSDFFLTRSRPL
jgi:hypothetical protein